MKRANEDRILIRKKNKYLNYNSLGKVSFLIVISMVSGFVGSSLKEIYFSYYPKKQVVEQTVNVELSDVQKMLSDSINKVSESLVTIADSEEKLDSNNPSSDNVTGVVIDKDGYIISSSAKIKNMKEIYIKLPSIGKKPIKASLIGTEDSSDVALLKVESEELVEIAMCEDTSLIEGNIVLALGNTKADEFIGISTPGMITSTNKYINDSESNGKYKIIESNAVINNENIGGALCNIKGEMVGFNSATLNSDEENSGLFYSLSIYGVKGIVAYLISLTDILGINGGNIIDDKETGVQGVYIEKINPDGYAARAGMLPTDIIIALDNKKIKLPEDIYNAIKDKKNGDTIICDLLRDGKETRKEIKLTD